MASTCVVDRSKWNCGRTNGEAALLNPEGFMCCLGFYSLQVLGKTTTDILNQPYPDDPSDTETLNSAYRTIARDNDIAPHVIDQADREARLVAAFRREFGCDLSFVGRLANTEPPKGTEGGVE